MNLDKVAAQLRHREGVRALDLGLLLGRRFWWAIIKPWLALVVPLLVVVQMVVGVLVSPWAAVAVGWWLKPLFDRVSLHVVSRGFFGDVPSTGETIRTVVRQWFSRRTLIDLSWRRVLGDRCVTLPIFLLEGNHRVEIGARLKALYGSDGIRAKGWLLAGMALGFKAVFYLSVVLLVVMLTPNQPGADPLLVLDYLMDEANVWVVTASVVAVTTVATTLVEPFYLTGGFGIYIQRRIEREGWDLEIRFRRLVERLEDSLTGSLNLLVAGSLAVLMAAMISAPADVEAEEKWQFDEIDTVQQSDDAVEAGYTPAVEGFEEPPVDDPQTVLDEIVGDKPFLPPKETTEQWIPSEPEDTALPDIDLGAFSGAFDLIAQGLWVLLWVLFFGLMAVAVVKMVRVFGDSGNQLPGRDQKARWEAKLAARGVETVLPERGELVEAVREHWSQGKQRQALAVMLVSTLMAVEQRHQVEFPPGWTVQRCALEVRGLSPEGPVVMALARAFDEVVWAGRTLENRRFDQLCSEWSSRIAVEGVGDE